MKTVLVSVLRKILFIVAIKSCLEEASKLYFGNELRDITNIHFFLKKSEKDLRSKTNIVLEKDRVIIKKLMDKYHITFTFIFLHNTL